MASGVAYLGQGAYQKAARSLLKVSREAGQGPTFEPFISPGDVALYATLCALATFDRTELKRRVIDNTELRSLLEFEPQLKDVLHAFRESRYKEALAILNRYSPRHLLDIHLSPHVGQLMSLIRNRAVVQYFAPFSSVSLGRMAEAFGWTPAQAERAATTLIESGELRARVDTQAGILPAHQPDPRSSLFKHAIEAEEEARRNDYAALLRLRLVQAEILVKEQKAAAVKGKKAWEEPS